MSDDIAIEHAASRDRYELRDDGEVIGVLQYRLPDDGHVDLVHTEVDKEHGGRGLATKLVAFAVDDIVRSGRRIIPHCPYVVSWLERHHDADEHIDWPDRS